MSRNTKKHEREPQSSPMPQTAISARVLTSLVLDILQGDPDSLDAIVANVKEYLFGSASRFLEEREFGREAWQAAYLNIINGSGAFIPKGAPLPWAWRIGDYSGFLKEGPQHRMAGQDSMCKSQCPAGVEDVLFAAQQECRGVVQMALGTLSKQERSVVELCCLEGLSSKEAAFVLNIQPSTIRSCLVSAKGRMNFFFTDLETSRGEIK